MPSGRGRAKETLATERYSSFQSDCTDCRGLVVPGSLVVPGRGPGINRGTVLALIPGASPGMTSNRGSRNENDSGGRPSSPGPLRDGQALTRFSGGAGVAQW